MRVTLITHTPDPEKLVAASAKLCYTKSEVETLMNGLTEQKIDAFLKRLADMGHESPLEHVTFTFALEGVSRSLLAQLTRHRIASYSVQSQRYVDMQGAEFIVPPSVKAHPEVETIYNNIIGFLRQQHSMLYRVLKYTAKTDLIAKGWTSEKAEKAAEKIALEDSRYVLPNACSTQLIVTMNVRSLHNFFRLRCCNRAQWEIRAVADEMLKQCKQVAPRLFANAGAPCVAGPCPEGPMSCGSPRTKAD